MYNHNKAQQSKNRVHISWDILYVQPHHDTLWYTGFQCKLIKLRWTSTIFLTTLKRQSHNNGLQPGVGVTGPIYPVALNFPNSQYHQNACYLLYMTSVLTCVAAAELRWHLSHMNVIKRIRQVQNQDQTLPDGKIKLRSFSNPNSRDVRESPQVYLSNDTVGSSVIQGELLECHLALWCHTSLFLKLSDNVHHYSQCKTSICYFFYICLW